MAKIKKIGAPEKDSCFVIMPFRGWFDSYYQEIFKPAIESAGLDAHKADDLYAPNTVMADIWEYTRKSKIILAILTDKNPNVFYELGLAHAIAKPVILITESEDDIPFDLRAIRIIKYDKNKHNWGEELMDCIKTSIKEILHSPKKSIPAIFLKEEVLEDQPISKHEKEILSIKQDIDFLKREVRTKPTLVNAEAVRRHFPIGMTQGTDIAKDLLREGAPEHVIFDRLLHLGYGPTIAKIIIDRVKNSG